MLQQSKTKDEIISILVQKYNISKDIIKNDVTNVLQKLCLNRLILKNFIFYSFSFLKNNHCILLGFYSF